MGRRLRRLGGEVARFTAVNGLATLVALVLFNLAVHGVAGLFSGPLHAHPLSSYVLANSVGMIVSYHGSRRWAFRHRTPVGRGGGAVNYVLINLMSFVIPVCCLWVSRNVLGYDDALADNIAGNVVGSLLGAVCRFWAFRTFVFTAHRTSDPPTQVYPKETLSPWVVIDDEGGAEGAAGEPSALGVPEVGPGEPELGEHQPEQRHADPDDVVRIPRHA